MDAQDQSSERSAQEGRRSRGHRARSGPPEPAHRARHETARHRPVGNIETLYKVGDLVTGKVTKLASFGAFVGLQHEIDGLVHISQISEERVDKIKNVLKVGQDVSARVIKIDRGERRIGLSIKAASLQRRAAQGRAEDARRAQARRRPRGVATRLRRRRRSGQVGIILRTKFNSRTGGLATVRLFFIRTEATRAVADCVARIWDSRTLVPTTHSISTATCAGNAES